MRPLFVSIAAALLLVGVAAAVPTGARAQETDADRTARARALFEAGVAHADAAEWEQAAAKFREALELRDAPAVRYNLASALVALGEYTEAESLARALAADPTAPPDLQDRARELLDQIAQSAGRLEVELRGATRGITVRIDGEPVDASRVVHEYSLAPRGYTVVIERDGHEIERQQITLEAGRTAEVSVAVAPSPEETAVAAQESAPAEEPGGGEPDVTQSWVFWTAVGGAVVMAILLAVVAAN